MLLAGHDEDCGVDELFVGFEPSDWQTEPSLSPSTLTPTEFRFAAARWAASCSSVISDMSSGSSGIGSRPSSSAFLRFASKNAINLSIYITFVYFQHWKIVQNRIFGSAK